MIYNRVISTMKFTLPFFAVLTAVFAHEATKPVVPELQVESALSDVRVVVPSTEATQAYIVPEIVVRAAPVAAVKASAPCLPFDEVRALEMARSASGSIDSVREWGCR